MKTKRWIERILVSLMVFCLAETGLGVQPVQASPPTALRYFLTVGSLTPSLESICQRRKLKMEIYFSLYPRSDLAPLRAEGDAKIAVSAKLGTVYPIKAYVKNVWVEKIYTFEFTYTAPPDKKGDETVTVWVTIAKEKEKVDISFTVKPCQRHNIRGSADIGSVVNAMNSSNNSWDFVGSYDIVGTVKANDDGTLSGQGTANLFADAIFIGGDSDVTCEHITPWEGNTTIEIGADPNAWANEGLLDLQIRLDPMPINSTSVVCRSPTGGGSQSGPSFTFASYDLDFDTLPMEGGNTSLYFHFPDGTVEFQMDLIASPEEAES